MITKDSDYNDIVKEITFDVKFISQQTSWLVSAVIEEIEGYGKHINPEYCNKEGIEEAKELCRVRMHSFIEGYFQGRIDKTINCTIGPEPSKCLPDCSIRHIHWQVY